MSIKILDYSVELWYHFHYKFASVLIVFLIHFFDIWTSLLITISIDILLAILKFIFISIYSWFYNSIGREIPVFIYNIINIIYFVITGDILKAIIPLLYMFIIGWVIYIPFMFVIDILLLKKITGYTAKDWGRIKFTHKFFPNLDL